MALEDRVERLEKRVERLQDDTKVLQVTAEVLKWELCVNRVNRRSAPNG
jgi:chaperonin cofactor prefoldin